MTSQKSIEFIAALSNREEPTKTRGTRKIVNYESFHHVVVPANSRLSVKRPERKSRRIELTRRIVDGVVRLELIERRRRLILVGTVHGHEQDLVDAKRGECDLNPTHV